MSVSPRGGGGGGGGGGSGGGSGGGGGSGSGGGGGGGSGSGSGGGGGGRGGTNKHWGPENKLQDFFFFGFCLVSLRAPMEYFTVLNKNFGVDFFLHCCSWLKLLGPLFGH